MVQRRRGKWVGGGGNWSFKEETMGRRKTMGRRRTEVSVYSGGEEGEVTSGDGGYGGKRG